MPLTLPSLFIPFLIFRIHLFFFEGDWVFFHGIHFPPGVFAVACILMQLIYVFINLYGLSWPSAFWKESNINTAAVFRNFWSFISTILILKCHTLFRNTRYSHFSFMSPLELLVLRFVEELGFWDCAVVPVAGWRLGLLLNRFRSNWPFPSFRRFWKSCGLFLKWSRSFLLTCIFDFDGFAALRISIIIR